MANAHRFARSPTVNAETLVIWGELDPALGIELLEGLNQIAPHVGFIESGMRATGCKMKRRKKSTRHLIDFLKELKVATLKLMLFIGYRNHHLL